ncbi:snaclec bitiscetin subunit beta-like [Ahaetulla prasina]|uniref:snaclec bitiscetin subunit beta-like n=1 Tax=Ahaetulla prasina TaxID=499056 RepID=UPI00264910A0|nr:snaclec bitiscetin subunit beta-like [Ahaetulla prasina]
MKLQILLRFLPAVLVLLLSEGTRAHQAQPLHHGSFFLNIGARNNLPLAKHEVLPVPDSALEDQNSFCQEGCRDGWMSYTDHCYMYVQEPRSWSEAERACQSFVSGGHLTSVSSAEHNDFLVKLATYLARKPVLFWIGGDHRKGGSLRWTDGSRTNFIQRPLSSLLNIVGGTINQILNLNIRVCLQISLIGHGRWDGNNCQRRLPFICSYKPDLTPP